MMEINKYRLMYFCTWCGLPWDVDGKANDFESLGDGWYDNVCKSCRQKEKEEGATMISMMSI